MKNCRNWNLKLEIVSYYFAFCVAVAAQPINILYVECRAPGEPIFYHKSRHSFMKVSWRLASPWTVRLRVTRRFKNDKFHSNKKRRPLFREVLDFYLEKRIYDSEKQKFTQFSCLHLLKELNFKMLLCLFL